MAKFNIDFYKSGVKATFMRYKKVLMDKGFTEKEAIEFLENIYGCVGEEYGN